MAEENGFDLKDWLSQQSTQKAILAVLSAAGIVVDPDYVAQIIATFLALYGVIAAFRDKS